MTVATLTLRGYDRAEAAYLSQPEHRLTDTTCDLCTCSPCQCDRLTDDYRDRQMED